MVKSGVKNLPPLLNIGELIRNRYKVEAMIGGGGFGQIFIAQDKERNEKVAIKIQPKDSDTRRMVLEHGVLLKLMGKPHIPKIRCSGSIRNCSYIAMDLLGRNLSELRRKQRARKFSAGTVYRIAPQIVTGLRHMHEIGYLHRDGMTRQFRTEEGFRKARDYAGFRGTIRYASPRVHARQETGPSDDLISLLYSLIELSEGVLPWTHIRETSQIGDLKLKMPLSALCERQPLELMKYANYIMDLPIDKMPDYELINATFRNCLPGGCDDMPFDWEARQEMKTCRPRSQEPIQEKENNSVGFEARFEPTQRDLSH
ncbi:protein kinase domain-containing protein [Ditylenchus destructor]|uniref:Protein kinase domain-containing protein n=1 Tax=Ditylenchus destructor TaxID=166010 RepID=A0AAD4R342_9BILA|nr:protein kinase domain-containing protein [Ditylenchus destructor]